MMRSDSLLRRAGPAVVAAMLTTAALCLGAGDSTQSAQSNRYVLLHGSIRWRSDVAQSFEEPVIMRMDTLSGRAWIYSCLTIKGRMSPAWIPVQEPNN